MSGTRLVGGHTAMFISLAFGTKEVTAMSVPYNTSLAQRAGLCGGTHPALVCELIPNASPRQGQSHMRSRSPLNHNETLLARSFTQPGPNEHDLTENVGPEELRGIARFLTRTARKLEAAARPTKRAQRSACRQRSSSRAALTAKDGKPEA